MICTIWTEYGPMYKVKLQEILLRYIHTYLYVEYISKHKVMAYYGPNHLLSIIIFLNQHWWSLWKKLKQYKNLSKFLQCGHHMIRPINYLGMYVGHMYRSKEQGYWKSFIFYWMSTYLCPLYYSNKYTYLYLHYCACDIGTYIQFKKTHI